MGHAVRYEIFYAEEDGDTLNVAPYGITEQAKKKAQQIKDFIKDDYQYEDSGDGIISIDTYHSYSYNLGREMQNSKKFKDIRVAYYDLEKEPEEEFQM